MRAFSDNWPFILTCQSCGHEQVAKDPRTYVNGSDKWRDVKCKACRNNDLDFGSKRPVTPEQIKELEDWEAKNQD